MNLVVKYKVTTALIKVDHFLTTKFNKKIQLNIELM